ncbi:polysaccharide biosynthesis C-terminal domain-containing protein, partial [bacterium AH-315-K03]|nr:polysaccharide biosynthesis C-terminal domain-containing protein [bacterium AH-315-K03]
IFGLGTALLFPLGIFSEVLRGAQLMPLRNTIEVLREMFNCIAIVSVLYADLGLEYVALVAVLIQFIANVSLCVFAHKKLPHMKLSYRLYQPKQQMGIFKFSFIAYIVMLSNLMIYRSDQLVISVVGGVAMVALYHVAVRMAELFRQLCSQLHDVLAPMSASLHRGGDQKGLRILYQTSLHYVTILVAIAIVPAIVYIDVFINLWLELDNVETVWCAQILLINAAVLVVFRNTSNQVLLMCGYHKACMWMGVAEAIANIVLSVILLNIYGIVGVALGTLIPNVFIAIVFNVPLASKFLGISSLHLFRELVSKMALILCGSIGSYLLIEQCLWNYSELSKALLGAPVIVLVALLMAYRWVLSDHERASLRQWFARTSTCYV